MIPFPIPRRKVNLLHTMDPFSLFSQENLAENIYVCTFCVVFKYKVCNIYIYLYLSQETNSDHLCRGS